MQEALNQLISGKYNDDDPFKKRLVAFVALYISEPAPPPPAPQLQMGLKYDKSVESSDLLMLIDFVRLKNFVSISLLHAYSFCLL